MIKYELFLIDFNLLKLYQHNITKVINDYIFLIIQNEKFVFTTYISRLLHEFKICTLFVDKVVDFGNPIQTKCN